MGCHLRIDLDGLADVYGWVCCDVRLDLALGVCCSAGFYFSLRRCCQASALQSYGDHIVGAAPGRLSSFRVFVTRAW